MTAASRIGKWRAVSNGRKAHGLSGRINSYVIMAAAVPLSFFEG